MLPTPAIDNIIKLGRRRLKVKLKIGQINALVRFISGFVSTGILRF